MDLAELPLLLPNSEVKGPLGGPLTGLAYNSKTVNDGELFFCLPGTRADGHLFAGEAVRRGAVALVVEQFLDLSVPQVRVPNARRAMAVAGRRFHGDPAGRLGLIGVTGTNGKTTTAFFIRALLRRELGPVGLVGTVYNQLAGEPEASLLTTPESLDLVRLLARAAEEGCRWVVMEVSSHALSQDRVLPADLDVAVVTNVTRDHLEFHGTLERYWEAKARIIRELEPGSKGGRPKLAVVNADDPLVMRMAEGLALPIVTFGLYNDSDVFATEIETSGRSTRFRLNLPGRDPLDVTLPMPGLYNLSNALAAAAVAHRLGLPPAAIADGFWDCRGVPGRAEPIEADQEFEVIVDFAHNPDALAKVTSLRPGPGGRTILVFGAEGEKDPGKRAAMGTAARAADFVIVTSDNTHSEEPEQVAGMVAAGLAGHPHRVILDRRAAIGEAIAMARPGDLVIIAGKGHEQTWVYGGIEQPFDDREVARSFLRKRAESSCP